MHLRSCRLQLHDLHLAQGRRTVLEHVDGDIKPGAITALIGANGAGKSTLIQAIMGELRPISGKVVCTVDKARRAWLPQQLALDLTFPMSVEELASMQVGQVIGLGIPIGEPVELHAGGRRLGRGELVNVEGTLGVRVLSRQ